ncbi:MAG: hypothetical protein ABW086_00030 [Sedimenticola sp.]
MMVALRVVMHNSGALSTGIGQFFANAQSEFVNILQHIETKGKVVVESFLCNLAEMQWRTGLGGNFRNCSTKLSTGIVDKGKDLSAISS